MQGESCGKWTDLGDVGIRGVGRRSGTYKAAQGAAREAEEEQERIMLWNPRENEDNKRNRVVGVSVFHTNR